MPSTTTTQRAPRHAANKHPPRIARSGGVNLVDILYQVQPNPHHLQQHVQQPLYHPNPFSCQLHINSFLHHPPQAETITHLANEYWAATKMHEANRRPRVQRRQSRGLPGTADDPLGTPRGGMGSPSGLFAIPPGCVPPPPSPQIGYDLGGCYGRAQSPAPSVFEVSEASDNDGVDSVVPDKMCTLNALGSGPEANDGMETVVARCVKMYKEEGVEALVNEVLREGTRGSLWNAMATRLVFEQLEKQGDPHVEQVSRALRAQVLGRFEEYWSDNGEWKADCGHLLDKPYSSIRGFNIASFIGSLSKVSILDGGDVHMCLDLLVERPVQLNFICAMHALVVHCDDKLCADEHWPGTCRFLEKLGGRDEPDVIHSVIADLVGVLDRWRATVELQAIRDSVYTK